ncbi:MAG: CAP domain-containing protein [Bacteroidales bacterium]|nr:CAP domain-containing protein [Bacteroidales bacterium]MCB9013667.1 CAP domain-containing protein [Bacteroidales bacterium]
MKKILLFSLLLAPLSLIYAQKYVDEKIWKRWDSATIAKANTAVNANYLSSEEKLVILITNLARTDGPLFSETFLDTYMEGQKPSRYSKSLYRDLKNVKNLKLLFPEKDLYEVAEGHAIKSGKNGQVGHQGFEQRFKPLMKKYNGVAENCAYGYDYAIDIVLQLLVDQDISNLGHRLNMLNPGYDSVGVSIQPHKTYRYNCVMDFGLLAKER